MAQGGQPRLLFVAHRVEILRQAMATYRQALRSPAFGEVLAEGRVPGSYDHLFASIQSVVSGDLLQRFGPEYWHTVVIDECHHLPAQSFDAFARNVRPKVLLGLTATPLRADGKPIGEYFDPRPDSRPAVELRLWDALDQQLLAPFEYYGTGDETDLSEVKWTGGASEIADLDRVISGDHVRARLVIQSIEKYSSNLKGMRALAFCVSVRHAEFMAARIRPALGAAAKALVRKHLDAGDLCAVVTATNSFVTGPIAREFGVLHLVATEPEQAAGRFTGRVAGTPCFREGKIVRVDAWLAGLGHALKDFSQSSFYSDSHNDLPLLERVSRPVAVDPDDRLAAEAARRGWTVISLR